MPLGVVESDEGSQGKQRDTEDGIPKDRLVQDHHCQYRGKDRLDEVSDRSGRGIGCLDTEEVEQITDTGDDHAGVKNKDPMSGREALIHRYTV